MTKLHKLTVIFTLSFFIAVILITPGNNFVAFSQESTTPQPTSTQVTDTGEPIESNAQQPRTTFTKTGNLSTYEFYLTLIVAGLAVIALGMEFFLLRKTQRPKSEDILRVFGVTLIIIGTLFFVTAGYNSLQIAPAMGLFGTVAGYLLGRGTRKNEPANDE
jgi:uncharacterized membrane protein